MKNLAERIKLIRDNLGLNQEELAIKMLATIPVVKALEQKKTLKIKPKYAIALQNNLHINREWLENGKGDMFIKKEDNTLLEDIYKISQSLDSLSIPFYEDIKASAGNGYINSDNPTSVIQLAPHIIPYANSHTQAIRVSGDSMSGTIEDNDIIFIDRNNHELINGKIYVLRLDDEVFVKRIFKDIANKRLILKSDNSLYPQFEIDKEDFVVIGRVIANISIKKL